MVKVYIVGYYYYCNNNDGDDCGHLLGVRTMLVGLVLVVVLLTGFDDGSKLTKPLLFLNLSFSEVRLNRQSVDIIKRLVPKDSL